MKRLLLLLTLLVSIVNLSANERNEQQMRSAAMKALGRKMTRSANELKEFKAMPKLKIYGYDDGGFAIVTNDDRFDEVIGYSASKYSEGMPCGFKWWLEASNEFMEKAKGQVLTKARVRNAIKKAGVGPLITTKWGQDKPYNNKCRLVANGEEYSLLTGCVATAMAQVMNYYKYPTKGKGENSYTINYDIGKYTYSANFANSYYDWDNMLDDYSNYYFSNLDDKHTEAVSQLMSDCGIAVNMRYNGCSSGTSSRIVPTSMENYFSYSFLDETKKLYERNDYSYNDWMNVIYNALNNNHPILYCGSHGLSGHMFVIHGYESGGKVLINWGWEGSYDGYFMIDMLEPVKGYSFNDNQQMIIPIPVEKPVVTTIHKLIYLVDGEIYKEYELKSGDTITPEPAPSKNGYIFSGWSNIPSTMPNHDVTITGVFTKGLESANTLTTEINGIYYNLIGKARTAEVTNSPNYYSGDIVIPETVECQGFTYKVTVIGERAFSNCHNLKSVSIPSSVTKIGKYAFSGCWNVSSFSLPNSIQDIEEFAFENCKNISSLIIPDGITKISHGIVSYCSGLKSIKIPDTVTSLGTSVFWGCSALESVSLPTNITEIGGGCFYECKNLSTIVIPDKITTINSSTFYGCTNLRTVTIGKSVKNIYGKAFAECKGLESIICMAEKAPSTDDDAFENSYIEYVSLYVPDTSVDAYKSASPWKKFGAIKGLSEYKEQPSITGDVNGDGLVNVKDIMAIINFITGKVDDLSLEKADVNGDGAINIADVIAVTNIIAGK